MKVQVGHLHRRQELGKEQLSMMKTLRTYSLMLFLPFLFSKRSKGARLGMKRRALNSSWPSTEKCLTARCSSQSFVSDL